MRSDLDDALIARVRRDLAEVATQVAPHPLTAERAVRGGRRRMARRRRTLTLATAGLTVVAAFMATVGPQAIMQSARLLWTSDRASHGTSGDTYAPLLTRTPGGDLISDSAYTATVLQLWASSHGSSANRGRGIFDDLRGPARVVWAGSTGAGRAALVVQQAYLHPHDNLAPDDTDQLRTLIGLVGTDEQGRPRMVSDDYAARGSVYLGAWFVDPGCTVLAAIDVGSPVGFGTRWNYLADGSRTMAFTPMTFTGAVATQRLPAGTDWRKVRVARLPGTRQDDVVAIAPSDSTGPSRDVGLSWTGTWPIAGTGPVSGNERGLLLNAFGEALDARTFGVWQWGGTGNWLATGRLSDGRRLLVGEDQLDLDPTHAYAILSGPAGDTIVHGGVVDPHADLPIAIRLPGDTGWVAVRVSAALRWRAGAGGPWHVAGRDAALLPAQATQVEVTPDRGTPRIVTLTQR